MGRRLGGFGFRAAFFCARMGCEYSPKYSPPGHGYSPPGLEQMFQNGEYW